MVSRFLALLIGTLALAALRGQFDALPYAPLADRLWAMAGYYTVLTTLGVAGMMFAVAKGWRMSGAVARRRQTHREASRLLSGVFVAKNVLFFLAPFS